MNTLLLLVADTVLRLDKEKDGVMDEEVSQINVHETFQVNNAGKTVLRNMQKLWLCHNYITFQNLHQHLTSLIHEHDKSYIYIYICNYKSTKFYAH